MKYCGAVQVQTCDTQELRIQDLEKSLFYLKRLIKIESTKKVE